METHRQTPNRISFIRRMRTIAGMASIIPAILTSNLHAQECPTEEARLLDVGGAPNDLFGFTASVDNDIAVVGAFGDEDFGFDSGSASIFVRDANGWTQQAKLIPADGALNQNFGISVSVSGETVIVGARNDSDADFFAGALYVYTRSENIWTQQAKIIPHDGSNGDFYGSVSLISGDTIFVGVPQDDDNGSASGSVYVYTRTEGVWSFQTKLLASDGGINEVFGSSISFNGDTAVIGAFGVDGIGVDSGAAYIFTRTNGVWTQQAKLMPTDATADDRFGGAVTIYADTAVIGAGSDDETGEVSGSAYVFTRTKGVWTQASKLLPDDPTIGKRFGSALSLSDDSLVIAAIGDHAPNLNSGSAYLFTQPNGPEGDWIQHTKILPVGINGGDRFGNAVTISGSTAIIGSSGDDADFTNQDTGSAYIFSLNCETICIADFNGDGILNHFDVSAFIAAFHAQDPAADFTNDGIWDFFDISAFLQSFAAGCP